MRTCLVSLLQYMEYYVKSRYRCKRRWITELDQIVTEVKQSEEWEAVKVRSVRN